MKEHNLWISRDRAGLALWRDEPQWQKPLWENSDFIMYCRSLAILPALRIPPNTKCRVRIQHLKSGDKWSLVGKPIKAKQK